mmetsp:Transcript_35446/g.63996  ORF Transcript_35446/g.63996 Transcript_35446/m.63996 type:complete len:244 (-) Transcript_35446:3374-4105(-)
MVQAVGWQGDRIFTPRGATKTTGPGMRSGAATSPETSTCEIGAPTTSSSVKGKNCEAAAHLSSCRRPAVMMPSEVASGRFSPSRWITRLKKFTVEADLAGSGRFRRACAVICRLMMVLAASGSINRRCNSFEPTSRGSTPTRDDTPDRILLRTRESLDRPRRLLESFRTRVSPGRPTCVATNSSTNAPSMSPRRGGSCARSRSAGSSTKPCMVRRLTYVMLIDPGSRNGVTRPLVSTSSGPPI